VGHDFAVIQNDALMALSDSRPERFHLFATLPLQDLDSSMKEIARVAEHPRVRGVQIGTNINGVELDNPKYDRIWGELEMRDLPVWFHPDQRSIAGPERLRSYYLQNLIGIPLDSTIAAARLIFGGVLDRHPELRFGFTHGGGFAPYQIGRWEHGWSVRPEPKKFVAVHGPRHYFAQLYFDSLTHDPLSLEMLGRRMGWDHVALGSDYPFDMASTDPVGGVEAVEMSDADRDLVFGGTAARFLRPEGGLV
jgi:aminocarboxymuconate-semialdehyde decarboxylase